MAGKRRKKDDDGQLMIAGTPRKKRYASPPVDLDKLHAEFDAMKQRYDELQARLKEPPRPEIAKRLEILRAGDVSARLWQPGTCIDCYEPLPNDGLPRCTPYPIHCEYCTEASWRLHNERTNS